MSYGLVPPGYSSEVSAPKDTWCCDNCDRTYCDPQDAEDREGDVPCPWCAADDALASAAKARLEGAREAWRIALAHGWYGDNDRQHARAAYLAAFGEEAP